MAQRRSSYIDLEKCILEENIDYRLSLLENLRHLAFCPLQKRGGKTKLLRFYFNKLENMHFNQDYKDDMKEFNQVMRELERRHPWTYKLPPD
mmetsp:Transcript_16810/g.16061  ORF Transcript_16810/g.16061 Transcript_16810/m.16061 type:complete len:92 (+) Transcript_16810:1185-1460(+)